MTEKLKAAIYEAFSSCCAHSSQDMSSRKQTCCNPAENVCYNEECDPRKCETAGWYNEDLEMRLQHFAKPSLKFRLAEKGIILDFGENKFIVSYEETHLPWGKAKEWAQERGGSLPTPEQAAILGKCRIVINTILKREGKDLLGGRLWANDEHPTKKGSAWVVGIGYGSNGYWSGKSHSYRVRVVTVLPATLE